MFNKPKYKPTAPLTPDLESKPMRPINSAAPSIIGSDIKVTGNVSTTGEIHLDGIIEGDVDCGTLTVGEHGIVTGTVKAETVTLRGTVEGKLRGKTIHLEQTAKVNGDVTYGTMTMEAGVQVDGKLIPMKKKVAAEPKPLSESKPAAKPAETKPTGSLSGNGNGKPTESGKSLI